MRDGPSNANAAVAVGDGKPDPFDVFLGGHVDLGSVEVDPADIAAFFGSTEVDPADTAAFFGSAEVDPADTADFLQSLAV